jgi:hypothetical protein
VVGYSKEHKKAREDWIANKVDNSLQEMRDRYFIGNNYNHMFCNEEQWEFQVGCRTVGIKKTDN